MGTKRQVLTTSCDAVGDIQQFKAWGDDAQTDLRDIIHRVEMADLLQRVRHGFDNVFNAVQEKTSEEGQSLSPRCPQACPPRISAYADFAAHRHYRTGPTRLYMDLFPLHPTVAGLTGTGRLHPKTGAASIGLGADASR